MFRPITATITLAVSLVDFAGHIMKRCAACLTLFNASIPGANGPIMVGSSPTMVPSG